MHLMFEVVIALVIIGVPLYLVQLHYRWQQMASHGKPVFFAVILSIIWLAVGYGSFIEPHLLVVREERINISDEQSKLNLVAISDLHLGRYRHEAWVRRLVAEINKLEPDAVVILGDIVDGDAGNEHLSPLADIESTHGTFAVLGNTDYQQGAVDVRHAVERYQVEVLTNEWVRLGEGGPALVGLDDLWYGRPDWNRAFDGIPKEVPKILAVHNPNAASRAEYRGVDLMLAGHTHGGQIRLPGLGPVPPLPTTIGKRYDQGLFTWGAMQLYITSGAGESGVRARLFNPPEIVRFDLRY